MRDVVVYRGFCSELGYEKRERMALHRAIPSGRWSDSDDVPFRLAFRDVGARAGDFGWRMSCLSTPVRAMFGSAGGSGAQIGDGSEEAAIAWLLEGEGAHA